MTAAHERGRTGERIAEHHFLDLGWEVLDRNWRFGHSELDLVVRHKGVLAFVEVKTRAQAASGDPLESITPRKRKEVERAALRWLEARRSAPTWSHSIRFDAVAVELVPGRVPSVRHVPDAWRIGDP